MTIAEAIKKGLKFINVSRLEEEHLKYRHEKLTYSKSLCIYRVYITEEKEKNE